jgi:hypothetical protein
MFDEGGSRVGFDIDVVKTPKQNLVELPGVNGGHLRLTGESMARMVKVMRAAGVLDDTRPSTFPDLPDDMDEDRAAELLDAILDDDEIEPPPTAAEKRVIKAYLKARGAVEGVRSPHPGRVPACKFGSNDNWLVWPEECKAIANGLDRWLAGRRGKGFDKDGVRLWVNYNRAAADHGGYRVN